MQPDVRPDSGESEMAASRGQNALQWYVAETLPRQEHVAIQNLKRQQFKSFCPRFRKVKRHGRRVETVLAPLFPGYVFVSFDRDRHPWRSIYGTRGVKRLAGIDSARPWPVPEAAMQQILSRCEDGVVTKMADSFEPGQQVRLINGPFAQKIASVESLDDKGRVLILLEIMGHKRVLKVNEGSIMSCSAK